MKKVMICVLTVLFFSSNLCGAYEFNQRIFPESYKSQCVLNLDKHGVVENITEKWNSNSLITRREIFEIVLKIKSENGAVKYDPEYEYSADAIQESGIAEMDDYAKMLENNYWLSDNSERDDNVFLRTAIFEKCKAESSKFFVGHESWHDFADVSKTSKDYAFTYALYFSSLLRGRTKDGLVYADLDELATYGDAINTLCRLFTYVNYRNPEYAIEGLMNEKYSNDGYALYHYAEEINLINTNNYADPCCPQISYEMLNETVTAYDFFVLLNRALYLPAPNCEDYTAIEMFYYIDNYR